MGESLCTKVLAKGLNVLSRDLGRRGRAIGQEGREVRDTHIVKGTNVSKELGKVDCASSRAVGSSEGRRSQGRHIASGGGDRRKWLMQDHLTLKSVIMPCLAAHTVLLNGWRCCSDDCILSVPVLLCAADCCSFSVRYFGIEPSLATALRTCPSPIRVIPKIVRAPCNKALQSRWGRPTWSAWCWQKMCWPREKGCCWGVK